VRGAAGPPAALLRQLRRPARQRCQPLLALLRGDEQKGAAAVGFFALLPIAVAIGVVVGRSNGGGEDNEALLQALRSQENAAVASTAEPTTTANAGKKEPKKAKADKQLEKNGGKVVAKTKNGPVHQVTGFKPTKAKEEEDTKLVEENPEQTGENYIKAQQNLPDVVVVGGSGGGSTTGAGD
jgi:hypothetical protein